MLVVVFIFITEHGTFNLAQQPNTELALRDMKRSAAASPSASSPVFYFRLIHVSDLLAHTHNMACNCNWELKANDRKWRGILWAVGRDN